MHNLKGPNYDGMPALFYKKYWDVVGGDLISLVKNFFNEINKVFITPLPKNDDPSVISYFRFRPINLKNVSYKGIAMIID